MQMQTEERAGSIASQLSQPGSVQYYFLAGDDPFLSSWLVLAAKEYAQWDYPYHSSNLGDCGQTGITDGLDDMMDDFFDYISRADTDGVVPLDSARGNGISAREKTTVNASHFSIVGNGQAIDTVLRHLTDDKVGLQGIVVSTHSPGHLHVYDNWGNHVGLDAVGKIEIAIEGADYLPYSTTTGDHESVWVPPGVEGLRVEFVADEAGTVGLDISQGMDDGLHWFGYKDIEVQPGSIVTIQTHPTEPEGQIAHPNGETISLSPTFSEIGSSSGRSGSPARLIPTVFNIWLVGTCTAGWVLVGGGLLGVVVLRRKQLDTKLPIILVGSATLALTIASCCLGVVLLSAGQSDGTSSQDTPIIRPSPELDFPASAPTPPSVISPELPQTSVAELTLINNTGMEVCFVLISPITSDEWGEDWLGSEDILSPGDSRTFQLPSGTYDLKALDCDEKIIAEESDIDLSGMMEWMIEE